MARCVWWIWANTPVRWCWNSQSAYTWVHNYWTTWEGHSPGRTDGYRLKDYFEFKLETLCGIPEITLEEILDNWKNLWDKTLGLAKTLLVDKTAHAYTLDQFVNAASGKIDVTFQCDMYKRNDKSGGPYITGWIVTLFPYLGQTKSKNSYLENWNEQMVFGGVTASSFPCGVVYTIFKWLYLIGKGFSNAPLCWIHVRDSRFPHMHWLFILKLAGQLQTITKSRIQRRTISSVYKPLLMHSYLLYTFNHACH